MGQYNYVRLKFHFFLLISSSAYAPSSWIFTVLHQRKGPVLQCVAIRSLSTFQSRDSVILAQPAQASWEETSGLVCRILEGDYKPHPELIHLFFHCQGKMSFFSPFFFSLVNCAIPLWMVWNQLQGFTGIGISHER